MLVQTPSQIFKADFAAWKKEEQSIIHKIIDENNTLGNHFRVTEVVLDEDGSYLYETNENSNTLILCLYGNFTLDSLKNTITSNEVVTIQSVQKTSFEIRNSLDTDKADLLIFEFKTQPSEDAISVEELSIESSNSLFPISKNIETPNFVGLYDGRMEETYPVQNLQKSIFGMVINGAFEFQNRLMESRDAIILSEIETLEFEALSENALLVFFEI
jgi:hypothetical protein